MSVNYEKGVRARISQEAYLNAVLKRFDMESTHPRKTPMETSLKISTADSPAQTDDNVKAAFQSMLGLVMYLGTTGQQRH